MADKRTTADDAASHLADGMTIGIGGWGSRRKPMALVRALLRSPVKDLTVVSFAGPDLGMLCAAGKVKRAVFGFASLDSIPLEPYFRLARQAGAIEASEIDEGMLQWGLYAAGLRLPFLPTRAGLGPDPYFDDLFCMAATHRFVSCERVVPTEELLSNGPVQTLRVHRGMVDAVIEAPRGASFTSCEPDYPRDEATQRAYAASAQQPGGWDAFRMRFLAEGGSP
jgi:glutaconate CoA-transferase subunit A